MQPTLNNLDSFDKSETTIDQALQEVRLRLSRLEENRAELDRAITAAREEERLLLRILALRRGDASAEQNATSPETGSAWQEIDQQGKPHAGEYSKHPAVQAVIRELAEAGRPLHISDLMRLLREGGIQIPGAGTQANLITHMRRDPRIVRPSRGVYGLSVWGLEDMPKTTRRKRLRKRVRSKSTMEREEA